MIFQPLSRIDHRLEKAAAEIEAEEIGLRVISARVFRLPFSQVRASAMVQSPRRLNVLEEFVLRAADDLKPPPTREELAVLLGLDRLFVDATCQALEQLGALKIDDQKRLTLTPLGQQYYAQGQVPRPPREESVALTYFGVIDKLRAEKPPATVDGSDPLLPGLSSEDEQQFEAEAVDAAMTLSRVIEAITAAGLGLHIPSEGKLVVGVDAPVVEENGFVHCGVFAVQDTVAFSDAEDNLAIRVIDIVANRRNIALERALNDWIEQERIKLVDLLPLDLEVLTLFEAEGQIGQIGKPTHAQLATEIYREQTVAARQKDKSLAQGIPSPEAAPVQGIVELLRDKEIRPRFMQSLEEAEHTILIVSPWITEEVVDEDFVSLLRDLAQRQVIVLIGWGIARRRDWEERVPPQALLDMLRSISTPDQVPAVVVWWVGNQHSKDVLVDHTIHMSGSHNWLSYRGDRLPRGESIYYITVPDPVRSALEYIEPLFVDAASREWKLVSLSPLEHKLELERCCATWVAARKPGEGIRRTLDLARSSASAVPVAIELMKATCLSLARLPSCHLEAMNVLDSAATTVANLLDSAQPVSGCKRPVQELVRAFERLLRRHAEGNRSRLTDSLREQRKLYEAIGMIKPGQRAENACADLLGEAPAAT